MTAQPAVGVASNEAILDFLAGEAMLAPSGDNVQPWAVDIRPESQCIVIRVDEDRDRSPMNAGQRMSRLAVGAAAENIAQTVHHNGGTVECVANSSGSAVTVRISNLTQDKLVSMSSIHQRATNRRVYDDRDIPENVIQTLVNSTPQVGDVSTRWITDREIIAQVAKLIVQGDKILFSNRHMRSAFYSNVRFDLPSHTVVDEGLSLGSLEFSNPIEDRAFRLLARLPNWLLTVIGVGRLFSSNTKRLLRRARGLCVLITDRKDKENDFMVGRAMQRAWLKLTEFELSVQPMMSLMGLLDLLDTSSDDAVINKSTKSRIQAIHRELGSVLSLSDGQRIAAILRFGYAPPPSTLTGRRPTREHNSDKPSSPQA